MTLLSRHIRDKKPSDFIRRGGGGTGTGTSVPFRPIRCWLNRWNKEAGQDPEKAGWKGGPGKGAFPNCTDPIIPDFPTGYSVPTGSLLGGRITREDGGAWRFDGEGEGEKKGRGKKRIVVGLLQIVSPCFPFFLFFLGRGRKLQEKYSAWKIKARGESLSYLLRGNHEKAKERLECIPFRIRKLS